MRLTVTFQSLEPESSVRLPLHYNHALQGFIYSHISEHLAHLLHDKGFRYEKRAFRLFTFSRLFGKFRIKKRNETITFIGPLRLQISSPQDELLQEFAETLARAGEVRINSNPLLVSSIEVHFTPSFTSFQVIKMLSPVTVYSTLFTASGKRKTYYFSPFEEEFSRLIKENIIKKYVSFYEKKPAPDDFTVSPEKINKRAEKIIKYTPKDKPYTIIKGWMGVYKLEGNPELIRLAYDVGLGAKNPQGFGMFEVLQERGFSGKKEESQGGSGRKNVPQKHFR